ncbi:MAG: hypothetical protein ACYC3I_05220 [Gemmataceae bacterium]
MLILKTTSAPSAEPLLRTRRGWPISESIFNRTPIVQESLETLLAQLAMSANVPWQDVPPIQQSLARRGWHIGRWLPTFLLIDGPLGRLLKDKESPLTQLLRDDHKKSLLPLLANARDAFNNDLFRRVRNGFGHWSFFWKDVGQSSVITILNWEKGTEEARLSLLESEALHFVSYSVIYSIDEEILRRV